MSYHESLALHGRLKELLGDKMPAVADNAPVFLHCPCTKMGCPCHEKTVWEDCVRELAETGACCGTPCDEDLVRTCPDYSSAANSLPTLRALMESDLGCLEFLPCNRSKQAADCWRWHPAKGYFMDAYVHEKSPYKTDDTALYELLKKVVV